MANFFWGVLATLATLMGLGFIHLLVVTLTRREPDWEEGEEPVDTWTEIGVNLSSDLIDRLANDRFVRVALGPKAWVCIYPNPPVNGYPKLSTDQGGAYENVN